MTESNLMLLCRRHHRAVHEEGWGVSRDENGRLAFTQPNGWLFPDVAPITELPDDPATLIKEWSGQQGGDIGPNSLRATDGTRLNLGYALDVLHPRSNPVDTPRTPEPPASPDSPSPPGKPSDSETPPDDGPST